METAKATPKDFFLWAGAMVSLYGSVIAFLGLIFDYINYAWPDLALNYYIDPYQGSVSYEMASLIVLAPLFLILMRVIRRGIAHDASRGEVWVRRWALYLTLFIAGATIATDLIVLLTSFLGGEELSARFLLKVLVVLLVAAAGFMHFMADLWGYWVKNPGYAAWINWAVAALVVVSVLAGFVIIGSPAHARQLRLDNQRISELQGIQSQVVSYYQAKQKLPQSLSDLNDPLAFYSVPTDPMGGQYEYQPSQGLSFNLCATFAAEDNTNRGKGARMVAPESPTSYGVNDNWTHGAGHQCFARTIDPARYPPLAPKGYL